MDCCNFCNSCWITIRTDSFVDQVCLQSFVDFFRIWIFAGAAVRTPVITNCLRRWRKMGISPFIDFGNTFGADHSKDCGLQKMTELPARAWTEKSSQKRSSLESLKGSSRAWATESLLKWSSLESLQRSLRGHQPPESSWW